MIAILKTLSFWMKQMTAVGQLNHLFLLSLIIKSMPSFACTGLPVSIFRSGDH